MKKFREYLYFINEKGKDKWRFINPPLKENPFKNYKQALNFLKIRVDSLTQLSNYKPIDEDWALFTIFKSEIFNKKLKNKK